jgi:outer membrane protein OmpA-like peptidoglycan-associated protein
MPLARLVVCAALTALLVAAPAHAGLGDALKKDVDKATKKASEAVDPTKPATPATTSTPEGERSTKSGEGSGDKVSTVSTKFDYVPGDSVLFLDDFTNDDLGEFPHQWSLAQGNFETAELKGERWLRGVSDDGRIRLKLPVTGSLPELWTLEFDILGQEPMDRRSSCARSATRSTHGRRRSRAVRRGVPGGSIFRRRHSRAGRCPDAITGLHGARQDDQGVHRPAALRACPRSKRAPVPAGDRDPDVRVEQADDHERPFALGPKPAKDLLASGKLVTHGIQFETGSDVVLPDSAPILRQVAAWMTANPTTKLKVTGHTDNVGSAASNLDLSKRRAASVARVLSGELGVAADRFETDGNGDTQTIASNAKPEGRAINRRVEFAKL